MQVVLHLIFVKEAERTQAGKGPGVSPPPSLRDEEFRSHEWSHVRCPSFLFSRIVFMLGYSQSYQGAPPCTAGRGRMSAREDIRGWSGVRLSEKGQSPWRLFWVLNTRAVPKSIWKHTSICLQFMFPRYKGRDCVAIYKYHFPSASYALGDFLVSVSTYEMETLTSKVS